MGVLVHLLLMSSPTTAMTQDHVFLAPLRLGSLASLALFFNTDQGSVPEPLAHLFLCLCLFPRPLLVLVHRHIVVLEIL